MAGRKAAATVHVIGQVRLRQRGPKKVWHIRYMTPAGRKEESLKVTNLKVAMRKARETNDMLERGEYVNIETRKSHKGMTFSEYLEEFRSNYTKWGEKTWKGNRGMLTKLEGEFGPLPLQAITTRLIESYLARRRDLDSISSSTTNRYLAAFKTMFKMAVRWGYIGHNPADPIKALREESEIPQALTDEQLQKLLEKLPAYAVPFVSLAADTGMRRSEMEQLVWSDVQFEERMIVIRGSGAKNDEFRVIPMTDRVFGLLQELKKLNKESPVTNLRVLVWQDIKKSLHTAGMNAGVGHVHLHMLRHTFATRLRDRGVPLDRIKELLGHKSMAMVLRYAKARPEQLKSAIEALNQ
jgi:integrase